MTSSREKNLLNILTETEGWVPGIVLSRRLGVTTRTVRNYVNNLIKSGNNILSSKNGYLLQNTLTERSPKSIKARETIVLSQLLTQNEINVFDLSVRLLVSDSLILNEIIPKLKRYVKRFNLKIINQNYNLQLIGDEKDKRKLIGYIVQRSTYGYSSAIDVLNDLFPQINLKIISKKIYRICQQEVYYINDYSNNNLMIHLLIMYIRLSMGCSLKSLNGSIDDHLKKVIKVNKHIENVSENIIKMFEDTLHRTISIQDKNQITLLIILSFNHAKTLKILINKDFVIKIKTILDKLANKYFINKFNSDFIDDFIFHIFMAKERAENNYSYPDPIGNQIKQNFSLIYDMAVFFAQEFRNVFYLNLNEDEISFIAIHFATYFSKNTIIHNKVKCALVNENYHDSSANLKNQILNKFGQKIEITKCVSINQFSELKNIELIISTESLPKKNNIFSVKVNQILTNYDLEKIGKALEKVNSKEIIESFLSPKLYFHVKKKSFKSPKSCIEFIGDKCFKLGYIDKSYINNVLLREKMSSTAFTDSLAIPHAIEGFAKKSFIAILQSDIPIVWANKKINIVMLIGLAESDMGNFNDAFSLIVKAFQSEANVNKLLNANTFNEFKNRLLNL